MQNKDLVVLKPHNAHVIYDYRNAKQDTVYKYIILECVAHAVVSWSTFRWVTQHIHELWHTYFGSNAGTRGGMPFNDHDFTVYGKWT